MVNVRAAFVNQHYIYIFITFQWLWSAFQWLSGRRFTEYGSMGMLCASLLHIYKVQYYRIKLNFHLFYFKNKRWNKSTVFNFSSKSCFMVLCSKRLFIHVYDLLHFCNLLLKVNAFRYYFLMFNLKMWIEINENWLYKFNGVLFFILWNLHRQYLGVHLWYRTNDS